MSANDKSTGVNPPPRSGGGHDQGRAAVSAGVPASSLATGRGSRIGVSIPPAVFLAVSVLVVSILLNYFITDYVVSSRNFTQERQREAQSAMAEDERKIVELEKLRAEVAGLKITNDALGVYTKRLTAWLTAIGGALVTLIVALATIYYNRTQRDKLAQDMELGQQTLTLGREKQELENRKLTQDLHFSKMKQELDYHKLEQDKKLAREAHLLNVFGALGNTEARVRIGAVAILVQRITKLNEERGAAVKAEEGGVVRGAESARETETDGEAAWLRSNEAGEFDELETIVSVLISVTKHEQTEEIQKYIADGIANGLGAILDPEKKHQGSVPPPTAGESPLKKFDFQGAQFRNAWWYSLDAREVDFYGANLARAGLREAYLSQAVLKNTDLSGATLRQAHLDGGQLQKAKLVKADLRGADLTGADLSGADLTDARLDGADLTGAILNGATIKGTKFGQAKLVGVDLSTAVRDGNTDLSGIIT